MTEPSETPKIGSGAESIPIAGSLAESARQHLAAMLEVPIEEIAVVSEQEVTWSDGSLGCPQPGNVYTQALVDGSLIVLKHEGDEYEYHGAGDRTLIYCANPSGSGYSGSK